MSKRNLEIMAIFLAIVGVLVVMLVSWLFFSDSRFLSEETLLLRQSSTSGETLMVSVPHKQDQENTESVAIKDTQSNEVVFQGTLNEIRDKRAYDLIVKVRVDERWVDIMYARDPGEGKSGKLINFDARGDMSSNIGKKVEVYALKFEGGEAENYSILGNSKYYLKVLP